jgi:NAD(P)-dependent dehydrogenase (short-subunit alcohol dehydrogenase family)
MASQADLDQTVDAVKAVGGRIVASVADVRDYDAVKAAVDAGVGEFGRLDIVCANAGNCRLLPRPLDPGKRLDQRDRHEPHGRLAHRQGGDPAHDRERRLGPHGERAKEAYRLHRLLPAPVVDHQQGVLARCGRSAPNAAGPARNPVSSNPAT